MTRFNRSLLFFLCIYLLAACAPAPHGEDVWNSGWRNADVYAYPQTDL